MIQSQHVQYVRAFVFPMQNEDATKAAVSTYLIDQGDGQVAYGTYRVGGGGVNGGPNPNGNVVHAGTLSRPPKTVNFDMGDDNYIDTLRRNAFSPGEWGSAAPRDARRFNFRRPLIDSLLIRQPTIRAPCTANPAATLPSQPIRTLITT